MASPFLTPGPRAEENRLALLHLRRDLALPAILNADSNLASSSGYAEGIVTNTRFGSFPHSTLVGLSWGSQVRASKVDTGSRGKKLAKTGADLQAGQKRKAGEVDEEDGDDEATPGPFKAQYKEAMAASSGFIHILPPTPENWTRSLPHRTQVVYTPDYGYILHRIRARPGSVVIEAGSGSGSFTHAAARAVFNGYGDPQPRSNALSNGAGTTTQRIKPARLGRVYSYEFHAERHARITQEMTDHGLSTVVATIHRDVYNDGFLLPPPDPEAPDASPNSPLASSIFLDLPAPWLALPHLTRTSTPASPSALSPSVPIHICTFSPCIEQAQRCVLTLRALDWLEIEMVEMQHRQIEVRRECVGLQYEGMRGVNAVASTVEEAVARLEEVENRSREYHHHHHHHHHHNNNNSTAAAAAGGEALASSSSSSSAAAGGDKEATDRHSSPHPLPPPPLPNPPSPSPAGAGAAVTSTKRPQNPKPSFTQGSLVHRSEPELKTHTSYLVFAVLPREWTADDERAAAQPGSGAVPTLLRHPRHQQPKSQRQLKREARQQRQQKQRQQQQQQKQQHEPAAQPATDQPDE